MQAPRTWMKNIMVVAIAFQQQGGEVSPAAEPADPPVARQGFVHRTSVLVGADIRNLQEQEIGQVEDLILEPASGTIEYAVLSIGGFLGLGEQLYAVPWSTLSLRPSPTRGRPALVLDAGREQLEKAPAFPKRAWPFLDEAWERRVREFYGVEVPAEAQHALRRLVRCSELRRHSVCGREEVELGEIGTIVVDPSSARVNYVVLESGGALGLGESRFVIPWPLLTVGRPDERASMILAPSIGAEDLSKAPVFDADDWDLMSNPIWIREVWAYWKLSPYWPPSVEDGYPPPVEGGGLRERERMRDLMS